MGEGDVGHDRRKRSGSALALCLLAAYPASMGPVGFARGCLDLGLSPPRIYAPIMPQKGLILVEGGDWRHVVGRCYCRCWEAGAAISPYRPAP